MRRICDAVTGSAGGADRQAAERNVRRVNVGAAIELREVVGAADELPLRFTGSLAPSHEAPDAPCVLDLTKDGFDELLSATVEGTAGLVGYL